MISELNYTTRDCQACGGSGFCFLCDGLGYDTDDMGQPCEACYATGECPSCEGEGVVFYGSRETEASEP